MRVPSDDHESTTRRRVPLDESAARLECYHAAVPSGDRAAR
jgi:hypothetical protein